MSATDSVPLRVPICEGVKVTLIVQLAPAATEFPQVLLLVTAKSPVTVILEIESAAVP